MAHAQPFNEVQRVAEYQAGWNDAMRNESKPDVATTYYLIGFIEALGGTPHRFEQYEGA